MPYGWDDGAWDVLWMILGWGLTVAIVVAIVVFVVRAFSTGSRDRSDRSEGGNAARTILDERFARGEIAEDEYRERTRVLEESRR